MKTPAETAMAGGKTTINNQLKAVAATLETAMMKAMVTTIKMKTTAAAAAAAVWHWRQWWQRGGSLTSEDTFFLVGKVCFYVFG
jgi:hypothetical protein